MARLTFTEADHARIASAIREAEMATTGEIYAVFARAATAMISSLRRPRSASRCWPASCLPGSSALRRLTAGTSPLPGRPSSSSSSPMLAPSLGMLLVPHAIAEHRAHRSALQQFFAHNLHTTADRTGILIFVSEAEHFAEIVADDAIAAKVPQESWDTLVADLVTAASDDRLADGYVAAAHAAGAILTEHFPATTAIPTRSPTGSWRSEGPAVSDGIPAQSAYMIGLGSVA